MFNENAVKLRYVKPVDESIRPPTVLQRIFRYRNQHNSQYYLTTGTGPAPRLRRDPITEEKPYHHHGQLLPVPDERNQWRRLCQQEQKLKLHNRHTSKSRQLRDIRERIYLPELPEKVVTIVDTDPEFFSMVEGRPVRYRFSKSEYTKQVQECALTRLFSAFREDEVSKIKLNFSNEEQAFKNACNNYNSHVDSFEKFLADDYGSAIDILKQQEAMEVRLRKKNEDYEIISSELGALKRKIYVIEEKCRMAKMYQDFLYKIAPSSWCEENNIKKVSSKADPTSRSLTPNPKGIFDKYTLPAESRDTASLEYLIAIFNEDLFPSKDPKLFFKKEIELLNIFKNIEIQNLSSWTTAEKITSVLSNLKVSIDRTTNYIEDEFKCLQDEVGELEANIVIEEKNAEELKNKALDIINTSFQATAASEDALIIHVCVEDTYKRLIFRHASFKAIEMMKMMESTYEKLMLELDFINIDVMKEISKEVYTDDIKTMKEAEKAAKKLRTLDRINRSLRNTLAPIYVKVKK